MGARISLLILGCFIAAFNLKAAEENLFNGVKGTAIAASPEIVVVDTWYDEYYAATDDDYFTVEKTQARVKLWFDDALKKYYSLAWTFTIEYDIQLIKANGSPVNYSNRQLSINYDPVTGYKDIHMDTFDEHVYIKAKVSGITVVTNTIPGGLTNDFHLDLELNTKRYYNLSVGSEADVAYSTSYLSSTKELELYWTYVQGAESYDVEWLFIDIPDGVGNPPLSTSISYDFKDATRINCLANSYKISMAYPRGLFVFRVRPVGKKVVNGVVKRVEGDWSLATTGMTGSASSTEKFEWEGLLTDMNWQYQASFAEEGKRGEMLGIYDGSLKPRQNVAINNSENTAIISQPIYDYLGRPALTLLPTPETNQGLGFYAGRTEMGVSDYYDYTNFDTDDFIETPDDMSGLGVNTYYSNNGATGVHADYVPDAEDYPYMRTAFLNDGTGRVKWQTAAGGSVIGASDIAASTTRIVKYLYGTPTQEELYRLFGNEVGNASHYKKNCVIDQNGQAHIQYLDMSGRVIGTALAGNAPGNLLQIDSYPESFDNITADLTVNNYFTVDGSLALNKTVVFPYSTNLQFTYSLEDIGLTDPCLAGTINPTYDLTIYIEDENHNRVEVDYDNDVGTADALQATFIGIPSKASFSWSAPLPPGTYTINKILSLNQASIDALHADFLAEQTCYTFTPTTGSDCNPSCASMCFSQYGFVDEDGNTFYQAENGDYVAMVDTEDNPTYYPGYGESDLNDIIQLIADCEELCGDGVPQFPEIDECETKAEYMLADMMPGGQYFDDIPLASGNTADNDWLVANIGADPSYIVGTLTGSPASWNAMRANWNPAWNNTMLTNHPEYCIYTAYCKGITGTYNGDPDVSIPDASVCTGFTGLTEHEYDQLMLTTNSVIDIADPNDYLFNPTDVSQSTSTTTAGDRNAYMPYATTLADDELDPFLACRPALVDQVEEMLFNFLQVSATDYHSIWYVINDPDNIHSNLGSSGYPTEVEEIYEALHGDGTVPTQGLIDNVSPGPGQLTAYQFFRGVYLYAREYAEYHMLDNFSTVDSPSECEGDFDRLVSPLNNGLTEGGYAIYYPLNPAFEVYQTGDADVWVDDQTEIICAEQCEQFAETWMAELGECIAEDEVNAPIMKAYLIAICEAGCDGDNPLGTDDISPATVSGYGWGGETFSSFEEVIDYYNTTFTPDPECQLIIHPQPSVEEQMEMCECNAVTDFVTNFYITNSVTVPETFNLLANLTDPQEDDLLADLQELWIDSDPMLYANLDLTDLQAWLTDCAEATPPTDLLSTFTCAELPTDFGLDTYEEECGEAYDDLQSYYDSLAFVANVNNAWEALLSNYTIAAYSALDSREVFTMGYELQEYHYTLFYYDQAGNLVKTVPPAGIHVKERGTYMVGEDYIAEFNSTLEAAEIEDCFDYVSGASATYIHPDHRLVTNYRYNSLQQLVQQTTPDGGTTNFWYDELGRLAVSQNAQQLLDDAYSYTIYDILGRVVEVGEITNTDALSEAIVKDADDYYTWLTTAVGGAPDRKQVVRSVYDDYANSATTITQLDNVDLYSTRNRIGSVVYYEIYDDTYPNAYDYALHYSYDENGNVKTLLSENHYNPITTQEYKRLDYEYDLASGNVNQVSYQADSVDEFYYRYEYDANNRLTVAYTSVGGVIWEKESKNLYYAHGPLARLEVGDKTVQAQDYVYTLNGWLKTVNSSVNNAEWDAGHDGTDNTQHEFIGRDAYGFSLHYYENDYVANDLTESANLLTNVNDGYSAFDADGEDLFNGNIGKMVVSLTDHNGDDVKVFANAYRYDQLQRIKSFKVYQSNTGDAIRSNNTVASGSTSNNGDYQESYTFDGNGNILSLNRNIDGGGTAIDDFVYDYADASGELFNNQLRFVDDGEPENISDADVDAQDPGNYTYNALGQLVSDVQEDIDLIEWTVTGKVKKITFNDALNTDKNTDIDYIEFEYDPFGNRVAKNVVLLNDDIEKTFYTHDATGNVMAVYEYQDDGTERLALTENHIYSGKRMGLYSRNVDMITIDDDSTDTRNLGSRRYELTNHLGNVLEVITDRRLPDPEAADFLCFSRSSSEYAYTASSLSAGLGDEMTIEAWVQSTDATNPFQTIARYFGTKGMHITLISGKVNAGFNNGSGGNLSGATVITDGNWHHVVVTAESGHIIIYVDGQMDGEVYDDPGDFNSINTNFYVGGYPNIINYYSNACIKEVSFWNYAKDATDVLGNFENYDGYTGLEAGLITYWQLTEGIGTACDNLVSGTHDLTAVNTPTWSTDDYLAYYVADVESYCDYTPFGMVMPGRNGNTSSYKFGYNGMEKDDEIKGEGNSYTTEFRQYDPRLARWLSPDPVTHSWESPYASMFNNPIINTDPDGADPIRVGRKSYHGGNNLLERMELRRMHRYTMRQGRQDIRNGVASNEAGYAQFVRDVRAGLPYTRVNGQRTIHYLGSLGNTVATDWSAPMAAGTNGVNGSGNFVVNGISSRSVAQRANGTGVETNYVVHTMPQISRDVERRDRYRAGEVFERTNNVFAYNFSMNQNISSVSFRYWERMYDDDQAPPGPMVSGSISFTGQNGVNNTVNFGDASPTPFQTVSPFRDDLSGTFNNGYVGLTVSIAYNPVNLTFASAWNGYGHILKVRTTRTIQKRFLRLFHHGNGFL